VLKENQSNYQLRFQGICNTIFTIKQCIVNKSLFSFTFKVVLFVMSERKEILTLTNNFVGELVLCRKYKLTRVDFYWILI